MLHADQYTGTKLCADDIVALFALGDKYDVPFVQEYVMNELSTKSLDLEELRSTFEAATRHQATALRTLLIKRLRWLSEEDFCTFLDATLTPKDGNEFTKLPNDSDDDVGRSGMQRNAVS